MTSSDPLGWKELFDDRILSMDSAHVFLTTAQSLAARSELIVEVGCGRGALVNLDQPGGAWQDLRGAGRKVIGIDVEEVGAENPAIDEFRLIPSDGTWPLDDASVDLAVSDFVLEHVTDPIPFVAELTRTLRPGGVFVARTVSKHSLLATGARMVPNESHAKVLSRIQPGREAHDVFRTAYQMNTRKDLAALFDRDFEWAAASRTGIDRYLAPWPAVARAAVAVERRFPRSWQTAIVLVARRRS